MIYITRLNHSPLVLNSDLIEHIETTPDTVITLTNGQKYMILEDPEEIVARVIRFRRMCMGRLQRESEPEPQSRVATP